MNEPILPLGMSLSPAYIDPWQKWALEQGHRPPPWYRPTQVQSRAHNHVCPPCDVRWAGPKNQPGPCWVCGLTGVEAA